MRCLTGLIGGALAMVSASVVTSAPAYAGPSYDAVADFSQSNNPNGVWTYGYGTAGRSFTAYDSSTTSCAGIGGLFCWYSGGTNDNDLPAVGINTTGSTLYSGSVALPTDRLFMHPTGNGATSSYDTIVQFDAPTAGNYAYSGSFQADDAHGSTGVTVSIWDGNVELFSSLLEGPGETVDFSGVAALAAGGALEFVVTASSPFYYDTTGLQAFIPEPGSASVLIAGLTLAGFMRRRRLA